MNRRGHFPGAIAGSLFLLALVVSAGPEAAEDIMQASAEPLEEITVFGKSMAAARSELHRAQERVFGIFNSLNSDDDYDVHCEYQLDSSHFRIWVCEANFVGKATGAEAHATMMGRTPIPAWTVVRRKSRLLVDEMKSLAREHPELEQALGELGGVRVHTESLREQRRAAAGE